MDQSNADKFGVNHEVIDMVWQSQIPVKIVLSQEDCLPNLSKPLPCFALFHRVQYPTVQYKKIHNFFKGYIDQKKTEKHMWLEHNNQAIPWNIPFGPIFDLLYDFGNDKYIGYFPFELVLHYSSNFKQPYLPLGQTECIIK